MFDIEGKCPHCNSDRGFHAFGISDHIIESRNEILLPLTDEEAQFKEFDEALGMKKDGEIYNEAAFSIAGECRKCHSQWWQPVWLSKRI